VIDAVAVAERVPDMVGVPLIVCDAVPLSVPVFVLVGVCDVARWWYTIKNADVIIKNHASACSPVTASSTTHSAERGT
jgi:hypothetical protein